MYFCGSRIKLLVTGCINTFSDQVVELNGIQVYCSTYRNYRQGLGFCSRPGDGAVLLMMEVPYEEYW